jgi:hypothetical protein
MLLLGISILGRKSLGNGCSGWQVFQQGLQDSRGKKMSAVCNTANTQQQTTHNAHDKIFSQPRNNQQTRARIENCNATFILTKL